VAFSAGLKGAGVGTALSILLDPSPTHTTEKPLKGQFAADETSVGIDALEFDACDLGEREYPATPDEANH
jgi:hypothetical protein